MKIRKLRIENFRGLSQIECDFEKPLNVIVRPNAIGKTTVLEAIRLAKGLLMPRYFQEGQQVLVSLGAASPHPQLSNYLDFGALTRDPNEPVKVSLKIEIDADEMKYLESAKEQVALGLLRAELARSDDEGQFALTQFLSSELGRQQLSGAIKSVEKAFEALSSPPLLPIHLTIDPTKRRIEGSDPFHHSLVLILERRLPPDKALFSYFPADRAFPAGEASVQIGSAEANNHIQSHIGQASTKYQRLKQSIVNNLLVTGLDQTQLRDDFRQVLERLLPGKELEGVSVTPVGTLRVAIREVATGKVFDIDSMSSGEKGLILTFMLLRRSLARGGIALVDEPELHLNPAVCKNIIPFLNEAVVEAADVQVFLCTHSAEILGTAFDHPNCGVYHLRSSKDATKIYERDSREVFDALRRLGTTPAETLFARGNIFVEGEHDAGILEDGFYEQVVGYRITPLRGRSEVEKEIATLQAAEKQEELDKLNCFIFDLDRAPASAKSTPLVRVLQWDRYCLENYLIHPKLLFDELADSEVPDLGSRGTFEARVRDLALLQLNEVIAKEIYSALEPDNPGLRPSEISQKSYRMIGDILAGRLTGIRDGLQAFRSGDWVATFVARCEARDADLRQRWQEDWIRQCSGKRLIDDIYKTYRVRRGKFDFKRRLAKRMRTEQSEDWTLVKSKLRDAMGA
jgi:predicted ATPase